MKHIAGLLEAGLTRIIILTNTYIAMFQILHACTSPASVVTDTYRTLSGR